MVWAGSGQSMFRDFNDSDIAPRSREGRQKNRVNGIRRGCSYGLDPSSIRVSVCDFRTGKQFSRFNRGTYGHHLGQRFRG